MTAILHLRSISHETSAFLCLPEAQGIHSRAVRSLNDDELASYDAILVPAHIDQRALAARSAGLCRFLDQGGTLVFNGHLAYPVLPGLAAFMPARGRGLKDLMVERVSAHPVFDGVDPADLSLRRGVAGFYGRGANPPPIGARVLHRLSADGSPLDWVWQRPGGGQVLMHAGNTMWMYTEDATTAARISPQLLRWLHAGAPAGV